MSIFDCFIISSEVLIRIKPIREVLYINSMIIETLLTDISKHCIFNVLLYKKTTILTRSLLVTSVSVVTGGLDCSSMFYFQARGGGDKKFSTKLTSFTSADIVTLSKVHLNQFSSFSTYSF